MVKDKLVPIKIPSVLWVLEMSELLALGMTNNLVADRLVLFAHLLHLDYLAQEESDYLVLVENDN